MRDLLVVVAPALEGLALCGLLGAVLWWLDRRSRWIVLILLLVPVGVGCGVTVVRTRARCADGLPARLLLDVACREGICGTTCAPDRWQVKRCP